VVGDARQSHLIDTLCVLVDSGVQFVVAGGAAMLLYGIKRLTLDLDIAVAPDQPNLWRFISTLRDLKFTPRAPLPAETILNSNLVERLVEEKKAMVFSFWCADAPYTHIDMFLTRENSFEHLVSDARTVNVSGRAVLVASRVKLIEMKCSVKPIRDKDLSDIMALQLIDQKHQRMGSDVESVVPVA
jgi:hypothetical protein